MIWETRCGVVDMILLFLEFHFTLPEPAIGSVQSVTSSGSGFSVLDLLCVRARCAVRIPNLLFFSFFPLFPPLSEKRNTQSGANFTFTIVNCNLGVPPYRITRAHDKFSLIF